MRLHNKPVHRIAIPLALAAFLYITPEHIED